MNTTTEITPGAAIAWFREQHERGDIDRRTRDAALKRWAQSGTRTWLTRNGWKFTIGNDAIACDCGKGIYCPLVKQTRVAR